MEELAIRENRLLLNGQELTAVTAYEIKSTAEDGYAEVRLSLLVKLV